MRQMTDRALVIQRQTLYQIEAKIETRRNKYNNVAVTPVYALWYITMCAGRVSHFLIIILWFINLSKQNICTPPQL